MLDIGVGRSKLPVQLQPPLVHSYFYKSNFRPFVRQEHNEPGEGSSENS